MKTVETPKEDLMNKALQDYNEASDAIMHFNSDIPKAIRYYFNHKKPIPSDDRFTGSHIVSCQGCKYQDGKNHHDRMWCSDCRQRDRYELIDQPQTKEVDYKDAVRKLLTGLECQHIEMFISKAKEDDYLKYGIEYVKAVKDEIIHLPQTKEMDWDELGKEFCYKFDVYDLNDIYKSAQIVGWFKQKLNK